MTVVPYVRPDLNVDVMLNTAAMSLTEPTVFDAGSVSNLLLSRMMLGSDLQSLFGAD